MTRKILDFILSPSGKFLIFFVMIIFFAMAFNYYKNLPKPVQEESESSFSDSVAIDREYVRFRDEFEQMDTAEKELKNKLEIVIEEKSDENDNLAEQVRLLEQALAEERAKSLLNSLNKTPETKPIQNKTPEFNVSPVDLFVSKPKKDQKKNKPLIDYAPYGRLIKCQLVNTIDSANIDTPIIALVTDDVWHNGKIIIPAGTELHGQANSVTLRNRISTATSWIFVWRTRNKDNGLELSVSGVALDYNQDLKSGRFHITDGSAGLRGFIVETDEYSKLKLYASLFLKGAAEGVTDLILEEARSQDQNTFINSNQNNSNKSSSDQSQIKVGMANGVREVTELYAQHMFEAITRDGVFVRVPAGTSFYLYVTQTIDKYLASPGASIGIQEEQQVQENSNLQEAERLMLSVARQRVQQQQEEEEK